MFSRFLLLRRGPFKPAEQSNILRPAIWRGTLTIICSRSYISSNSCHDEETISLPVGGNGHVDLRILRPRQPAKHNDVLVYLPPGPLGLQHAGDQKSRNILPDVESIKDALPTTTIVELQYRLSFKSNEPARQDDQSQTIAFSSPTSSHTADNSEQDTPSSIVADHRFPTPIHDVYAAWDYITESLELYNHEITEDGQKMFYEPKICLYGAHIGGALALSLALTNPELIRAVAVQDIFVDWTGIDEMALAAADDASDDQRVKSVKENGDGGRGTDKERRKRRDTKKQTEKEALRLAAREMMRLRGRLFRTHSGYFDAFASPTLFLRAPGRDTPVDKLVSGEDVEGILMRYGEEENEVGVVPVNDGRGFGPYDDDWEAHASSGDEGAVIIGDGQDSVTEDNMRSLDGDHGDVRIKDALSLSVSSMSQESSSPQAQDVSKQATYPTPDPEAPLNSTSSTKTISPSRISTSTSDPQPRRRKVLRRWPPTHQSQEVLLPHIHIFLSGNSTVSSSTSPNAAPSAISANTQQPNQTTRTTNVDIAPLLQHQAIELQDLLRRACFWGRERGVAEERVLLTDLRLVGGRATGGNLGGRLVKGEEEEGRDDGEDVVPQADVAGERQIVEWLVQKFEDG